MPVQQVNESEVIAQDYMSSAAGAAIDSYIL